MIKFMSAKRNGPPGPFCQSISVSSKISSANRGSMSISPVWAAMPRCSRRLPPVALISASAADQGWRLRPRAHQRSALPRSLGRRQHLSDGARRFANQENRRSQGQVDRCFHGGLAQRLVRQANGDPGRLGSGRHTHRTIGCGRDQHRRAQVQAGGCRGAVYRGGFRSRRAQRRPPMQQWIATRRISSPMWCLHKVYRREQTRDSGTFPQGLLCGNCFYESTCDEPWRWRNACCIRARLWCGRITISRS